MRTDDNPWLRIPVADYEAHMEAVGQSAGRFSVIIQEPLPGIAAVSSTCYESLQMLSSTMSLRSAQEVASLGSREGFLCESSRALELPSGKILIQMLFRPSSAARSGAAADEATRRD